MTETTRSNRNSAAGGSTRGGQEGLPGPPAPVGGRVTRGDLLRDRDVALRVLHQADLSLRTLAKTCLVVVAAAAALAFAGAAAFTPVEEDRPRNVQVATSVVVALVCVGIALPLLRSAFRRTLRARDIGIARRAWEDLADAPEARGLPRGDLDPALREPFDARKDEDRDEFVRGRLGRMYVAPLDGRLLVRTVPTGLGLIAGFAAVAAQFAGEWNAVGAGFLPAGLLVLGASGVQAVKSTQRAWRATQQWKRAKKEYRRWCDAAPAGAPDAPGT